MGNQCCGEMRNADKQNGVNGAYTTVKPGDMPMDPQHTQGWGVEGQTAVPQAPGFPGRGTGPPPGRMPPGPMNMMRGGPPPGPVQPTYDEFGNEIYPPQQNMAPRPSAAPFPGRGPRPPVQQAPPPAAEPYWDDQQQQWIHPQPQEYEGQQSVDEWGNPVQSTQGHEQQQNTSHDSYGQNMDPSQQHSDSTGYDASQNSYSDPSPHSEPSYGEGELSVSQDSAIPSRPPSQSISGRPPSASIAGRPPSGSIGRRPPPNPPVLAGQSSAPGDEGALMGRPPSASMSARPAPRQGPPAGPGPAPGRGPMGRPSVGRRGPPAPQRSPPAPQQGVDNYGNPIDESHDGYAAASPGQRPNPVQIPPNAPTRGPNMAPLTLNGPSRSGPPTPGRGGGPPTPGRLMTQASSGRIVNPDAPPAPELNPPLMSQSSQDSSTSAPGAHGVSADELSHARLTPQGERRRTMSQSGHQPQKSEDLGDFLTQALIEKRNQLTGNYSTLSIPGSGTTSPTPPAGGPTKKFKPPASPRLGGRQMGPPSPSPPPSEQDNYGYDQQQVDPSQQPWDEQSQQQYDDGTYQQYDANGQQQYDANGQQQYQEWQ